MKKKILLISYWINKQGNSPGIMADDKIYNLSKLGYKIIVLSSCDSSLIKNKNIIHYRVPSISFNDFFYEFRNRQFKDLLTLILFLPIIFSLGIILDIIEYLLIRGKGGGKWFWFIPAMVVGIFVCIFYRVNYLLTTGGPASAHLAGLTTNIFFKKKLFIELQDPLVGKDIGRSKLSSNYLIRFEKLILKYCYKLIFVTKAAAKECRLRNPDKEKKIKTIYSGAVKISNCKNIKKNKIIKLTHLGTLYTSRNFNKLILAINSLNKKNKINLSKIKIYNFGDVYGKKQIKMLDKFYIHWTKSTNRVKALKFCCESDILLLVQHTDDRSKLTFPFKVYEYLNLKKVIFALINNNELKNLLTKRGHVCADINNVLDIEKKLNYVLKNKNFILKKVIKRKNKYEINSISQCKKIFQEL